MQELLGMVEERVNAPNDEKTPFNTKYEAYKLISQYLDQHREDISDGDRYILCAINSRISFDTLEMYQCRQNLLECEKYISHSMPYQQCVDIIRESPVLLQFVLLAFNTRSIVYGNSEQYDTCQEIWVRSEKLYNELGPEIMQMQDQSTTMYSTAPSGAQLKNQFVHSLFIAAQVYAKAQQEHKSAELCDRTLQLQSEMGIYDKFEFIKNAVDLTRFYTQNGIFTKSYELFKKVKSTIQEIVAKANTDYIESQRRKFVLSRENLSDPNSNTEDPDLTLNLQGKSEDEILHTIIAKEDDLEQIYGYYRELGCFYLQVVTYMHMVQVKCVNMDRGDTIDQLLMVLSNKQHVDTITISFQFLQEIINEGVMQLDRSTIFFKLDGWTTNYCKILLDKSHLFDLNSKFCPYNLIQLQRRRISMFDSLRRELNPMHYGEILEEMESHLADAKYEIFDFQYKKMLQKNPYFENIEYQLKPEEAVECQKLCNLAAVSVEQFQVLIQQVEKVAQERCKCQENEHPSAQVVWERWVKWIHIDSLEVYTDAVFRQSVIFSKFPTKEACVRKTMMERALRGFEYCEKMWKWIKEKDKGDVDENLKLVDNMMTLMKIRIGQLGRLSGERQ